MLETFKVVFLRAVGFEAFLFQAFGLKAFLLQALGLKVGFRHAFGFTDFLRQTCRPSYLRPSEELDWIYGELEKEARILLEKWQ